MKTNILAPRSTQGNTLILVLVVTGLIGFILIAYLNLVRSQHMATFRSQAWNSAVPVIEAGIEDAMTHLNTHGGTNLACDGWTQSGALYTIQRYIGDSYYQVSISNYTVGVITNAPVIESRGYVAMPVLVAGAQPQMLLAYATVSDPSVRSYLARGVRVTTKQDYIFSKGLVAKDTIDLNGNNIKTDSFDSTDPNASTNGQYTASKAKANGDIATNSSLTNSLNIGNADIYGRVSTGPHGSVSIGNNGSVGDLAWHTANQKGIEPGYSKDDMNVDFPDVQQPFSGGAFTPSGGNVTNSDVTPTQNANTTIPYPSGQPGPITTNSVTGSSYPSGSPGPVTTNWNAPHTKISDYTYPTFSYYTTNYTTNTTVTYYDYILEDGNDYQLSTLSGKTLVRGNARLLVTDGISLSGQDSVTIKGNASLKLYMSGASAALGGNGVINPSGNATNFSYYGMPGNTSISISGNGTIVGTIYAPYADLTLNGGGSTTTDFVGAAIAKKSKLNGHFNFHYDESLARWGPVRGYVVTSWNELTPQELGATVVTTSSTSSSYGNQIY